MTRTLLSAFLTGAIAASGQAATINLTPTDIHADDTTTVSFSDGSLSLTPLVHDGTGFAATTFNGNAARLGIDEQGTNNNAFNDGDLIVGNAGDEALEFDLEPGFGLSQVSYDFSRADGPGANDGVVFSGFTANPIVTFSVANPNLFAVWDGVDSVRVNIPGSLFGGVTTNINFNSSASEGQTILMTVNDTTQAGAQLAIRGIAYSTVPEPTTLSLCGLVAAVGAARRRR